MERKEGYYWIKESETSEWNIAFWDGFMSWWFAGNDSDCEDKNLFKIDETPIERINYTSNDDHNDSPNDWLFGALTFGRTIGLIIPENSGVVVDLQGDMIELYPDAKRVIVANTEHQIKVIGADERTDLKEGDWVKLIDEKNIIN